VRFLLVRHGEAVSDLGGLMQSPDDALTERGQMQSIEFAEQIASFDDIIALYSSPFPRAWDTAVTIGEALGMEPICEVDLRSLDVGDAAGVIWEEANTRWPQIWEAIKAIRAGGGNLDWFWPGGETPRHLRDRVIAVFARLILTHVGDTGTVVVVTHGSVISWVVAYLLEADLEKWPMYDFGNCSTTLLIPTETGFEMKLLEDSDSSGNSQ